MGKGDSRVLRATRTAAVAGILFSVFLVTSQLLIRLCILHSVDGPAVKAISHSKTVFVPSQFNIQAQAACETKMLREMGAHEVSSGKGYEVLTEVARAYGRAIPHIYVFPESLNIGYIAASTAVDGRGKIVAGEQAIEMFDAFSLKGFLGHEMAHLVSDRATQGCNDYIFRNPQMEAAADTLAARRLGTGPLKAFLQRVLALTRGQNWDAKHRLEVLQ